MLQDPLTLYKLIVLYMLNKVSFSLTTAQISDFILDKETLNFFSNRISDPIKADINSYLKEHEFSLRNEVSVQGDYYKSTSGDFEAHLVAKDRGSNLVDITLSVPLEEMAASICDNWQKKNQEIYKYLVDELF